MVEHSEYAGDFIRTTKPIKELCPHVKASNRVSNSPVEVRGVNIVCEPTHAVLVHHACIDFGMDRGIADSGELILS